MTKHSPFRYFKASPEIIRLAAMLYVRFPLSLRNVEDLLHERLIGRADKSSGSRVYRVQADEGTNSQQNGFDGFLPSHTEKAETLPLYKEGETNPLNPSNPFASPLDDVFDPDNWA